MSWFDQMAEATGWHHIKPWITGALLVLGGLTFLGKTSSPSIIVADAEGRLGIIESAQFKTNLDESLPGYVAWSWTRTKPYDPNLDEFRRVLQTDDHDHSFIAQWGLNWWERSPMKEARKLSLVSKRYSTVVGTREASIWKNQTRDKLVIPIPFPAKPSSNSLHIARIPPRVAKTKSIGHVKPDSDREAVWLKSILLDSVSPSPKAANGQAETPKASRARELDSGEYLVGWLFVITTCHQKSKCGLVGNGEAGCLKPETLTDHVLGMSHAVLPRTYLYTSNNKVANQPAKSLVSDILTGGGLTLLTGADYDYVSLRVSHYPRAAGETLVAAVGTDSSAVKPSQTKEYSIAALDERLHEILATINRANDLNEGDLVLVLPTALDTELGAGDYLIVGLDDVPPPLRSHYRGGATAEITTNPLEMKFQGPLLAGPTAQARKPAARMRAAVDE